jgi:ABC-type branched-subunit amino acid transport system substrate-binding protein
MAAGPAKSDDREPRPGQGGYRSIVRSTRSVLPICLVVVLAACGARLTGTERLAGIRALQRGGASNGGATTGTGTGGFDLGGGTGTGSTNNALGPGGASGLPVGIATVPPGGNGGKTDTGVTATEITLATASDITGVQAGLFKSTWQAMNALQAMVNSQGGLYGRRLKVMFLDTKTDSTANQAAVRSACDKAFALVGSMSAFDNGGAETGEKCGIPDVSAIPVNPARSTAWNVFAANPIRPDKFAIGTANYIKNTYGDDVIKNAALLYLNAGVTKSNAEQRRKAYQSAGFVYRYYQQVEVLEPNYGPFVQAMKDKEIQYVNMVGNYQSIQKLLKAMDQAEWYPKVNDWDSVAYSQNFLSVGPSANNSLVFLNTGIYEEISSNPEMQLYYSWLSRVAPGAKPDFFGFYAWSAGRLFLKVHEMVGPKITRKAFFAAIKTIHSWDGYGLHAAHDIGNKLQSPCFMYLKIVNEKFVRLAPPNRGLICNMGGIINT